jgi:hypothetical protein
MGKLMFSLAQRLFQITDRTNHQEQSASRRAGMVAESFGWASENAGAGPA